MPKNIHKPSRVLIIGHGSIAETALPLLLERLPLPADRITIADREDRREALRPFLERGLRFERIEFDRENYPGLLEKRLGRGDILIDLSTSTNAVAMVQWCQNHGVLFLNTSVERWGGGDGGVPDKSENGSIYRHLLEVREWLDRHGRADGPTALIDHGANPGLVNHFVKQALEEIAAAVLDRSRRAPRRRAAVREALDARAWARLAEALNIRVIHISEIDTQVASTPRPQGEFQSTWSTGITHEESMTLSELCWGTHEGSPPPGARVFRGGPEHMIYLNGMGVESWVKSWSPGGPFPAMVIGHDEAFTIGEQLTVMAGDRVRYRPTVHFAYRPCQATLESLVECLENGGEMQPVGRVLARELVSGRDQLGCLLMGHLFKSWWIGSLLSVEEARTLAGPDVNATSLQVAASLAAALEWLLANPDSGPRLPDDLPHDEILRSVRPYLGPFRSGAVDWSPTGGDGAGRDPWRYPRFRTGVSLSPASHPIPARRSRVESLVALPG